jgi:signal-transduction protein with cAMP-binding, CBS, and nucleotidyltransferase domain
MKAIAAGSDPETTPVSAIMTANVTTVSPTTPLPEAARHMATRWIRHLPVVDGGKVIGLVSQRDLCGVLAALGSAADLLEIPADELVRSRRMVRLEGKGPR